MNVPLWVVELAEQFWELAGEPPGGFPRRLGPGLALGALDITVQELHRLSVRQVEWAMARVGIDVKGTCNRSLRGCLVAHGGKAWLFVDASDPDDEREATRAHELAHFLRHYWQPRQRAVMVLGDSVREVLDQIRPARPQERLHALLRQMPLGLHVHLMDRGEQRSPRVPLVEREADWLACELLAPAHEVQARLRADASPAEAEVLLHTVFGLVGAMAKEYAARLLPQVEASGLIVRLKKGLEFCRELPIGRE